MEEISWNNFQIQSPEDVSPLDWGRGILCRPYSMSLETFRSRLKAFLFGHWSFDSPWCSARIWAIYIALCYYKFLPWTVPTSAKTHLFDCVCRA